jgi:hypothetical protein
MRTFAFALAALGVSAAAAAPSFPDRPPEIPQFDLSFLTQAIPAEAITTRQGTDIPAVRWDHDGDGRIELWADWDPDKDQFATWTHMDPVTELPDWRVRVAHRREPPYEISWDVDHDGQTDWTLLDANRDGHPEELLWHIGVDSAASARFIDRNGDGRFEVRCQIDLTGPQTKKAWAFDDDGDGTYERQVDGSLLTENGHDPAWAEHVLEADPGREDLQWDLIGWCEAHGDVAGWRRHVLAYAADPQGDRIYELTYRPLTRRMFHTDPEFRAQLLDSLRARCSRPTASYGTLWALGEFLRWVSTPPEVHPVYLAQWREQIGLPASAELPTQVDPELVTESEHWFKQSLASEMTTRAARETVAFRLARIFAAKGQWDLVRDLCTPMVRAAESQQGPISARHLELADMCFAYGNIDWATDLYSAMAAHWLVDPSDPDRAVPNHIALIRLGILAMDRGAEGQARYFLLRALDSLTPEVKDPDTRLAELLLAHSETRGAAEEYLHAVSTRSGMGERANSSPQMGSPEITNGNSASE